MTVAGEEADKPSFERDLQDLETVVKKLEAGELPLEESLQLFERGVKLGESCRKQLEDAETRVEILIRRGSQVKPEAFQPEKS